MNDPIDALDPLVPKSPDATAPSNEPEPTESEKAEALKVLAAKQQALAELHNAVDAHTKGGGPIDPALVDKAEAFGHKINRPALIEQGLLPTPPPLDLDAAPEQAPETETETPMKPEPDPMVLVDGMVVLYNPTPGVITAGYDGDIFSVRPNGADLVKAGAADAVVGRDNSGGPYSKMGVRRMFGPEPRFQGLADESGVSLESWVRSRNDALIVEADDAYHAISGQVEGDIADASKKLAQ